MEMLAKVSQFFSKYFAFFVIIISFVAFLSPDHFTWITPHITILLGVIMFGMGLTLKLSDFRIVLQKPIPVLVGVLAQFVIMPLVAFALAYAFNLPPELAAGLVLVGACPGGTASNVMVYLAKGNVAASVAMTSVSTMLAPIVTPFILLLLAGQWLPIDAKAMFVSILQMIIVPIALGLFVRKMAPNAVDKSTAVLPLVSIVAIMAIVSAVVGANQANLMSGAALLFLAVMLHNVFGLLLGYLTAKFVGLDESTRRAISIEVGMQNSGLGAALAGNHFSPLAALPSAIFSVWHNISGPVLVSIWSRSAKSAQKRQSDADMKVDL
ncbi:bile acid:sodium symporter family protein [Halalkalibacterium halodurans]|jgi:BASS family bile acid:Na+ symporter|uniref:Sodium-dependent transporter n=2 Tax=Halalkalibacterium halodurans TaxID=86665 RepID=Q9KEJ4_HALH5|nr:bile acid:sodium symporter family protein [Halalkalibacterium halodurans]MED3648347.1 bile acid:sodium symporter family protein [Halalkalibacterium halodurans]MED4080779.1 bile acid:sodium symporter family protein [Halalkalibacterium halodurans]MED4086236.1 bile acid:sodium symporter family protein [Halalkalibacterium halodurans]MED4106918.1 bile acid:sodium symporter family protein [Halalkalibacterium halodurans]MED4110271.1 bile acid:sodium symporter family protein [Halalkalibacterium hal